MKTSRLRGAGIRYVAVLLCALQAGCQTVPTVPGFGNFGGSPSPRAQQAEAATPAYDAAKLVRWFPIQARFAPDGS